LSTSTARKPTVRKPKPLPTAEELEALWRKDPAFIGPVAPPLTLWERGRGRGRYWEQPDWWLVR
jgi:hypothetical protein